jgi:glycosyltransferase involved in cell wall biosynthesis
MSPRISVLIPTYNYARFLPEAIRSVLSQRYTDFELLIVDNASTDGTREAIAPFLADPRVAYRVNPTNLGMVPNWNVALEAARGEYVKFLFGDDFLCSDDALARFAAVLDDEPDVSLVASARHVVDEASRRIDTWSTFPAGARESGARVIELLLPRAQNLVGEPSCVMFRKAQATRGFDRKYRQLVDLEMWFHLLEGGGLAYLAEPLVSFRRHGAQETVSNAAALAHYPDVIELLAAYGPAHLRFRPLELHFKIYHQCYLAWRTARKGKADPAVAARMIAERLGPTRFWLEWLPYEIYKKGVRL